MPNAALKKPIEIFRAGTFTAVDGRQHTFTTQHLRDLVDGYSADLAQAPLVIGHPTLEAPAYGRVERLELTDQGVVLAHPANVEAQFAGLVNEGRYDRVSSSVFLPGAAGNPTPGKHYLRHVGFLGASAPAIAGLARASFAAASDGIADFAWADRSALSIFRRLRDWMIGKDGLAAADEVIPQWSLDSMVDDIAREELIDTDANTGGEWRTGVTTGIAARNRGGPTGDGARGVVPGSARPTSTAVLGRFDLDRTHRRLTVADYTAPAASLATAP